MIKRYRSICVISVVAILSFLLSSCSVQTVTPADNDKEAKVSVEQAKEAALDACKVKLSKATISRRSLKSDKDGMYYDFVIQTRDNENRISYNCKIDADTGEVISTEKQVQQLTSKHEEGVKYEKGETVYNYIGVERAEKAACDDIGISMSSARFDYVKLQYKDDRAVYVIELTDRYLAKYKFDVDAIDGKVLERSGESNG